MGLLVTPAGQTSWTDQVDRPAGRTSSFYLKPWPVPFSLNIVAASESDEGLVYFKNFLGRHLRPFLNFLFYEIFFMSIKKTEHLET